MALRLDIIHVDGSTESLVVGYVQETMGVLRAYGERPPGKLGGPNLGHWPVCNLRKWTLAKVETTEAVPLREAIARKREAAT